MSDYPYYKGYFWVVDSDILKNRYKFECMKIPCDYEGNYDKEFAAENGLTRAYYWNNHFKDKYEKDYNYFPSGKVDIHEGIAYIKLPIWTAIVYADVVYNEEDKVAFIEAELTKKIVKEFKLKPNKLKIEVI